MGTDSYIDARTDAVGATIEGSVCVIGAGAAGLTLVRRLTQNVPDVILIESGGFDIDGDTQNLYSGRMLGLEYYDLATSRLRYFGGTTNHWAGYCRAYDAKDFEAWPALGLPGWPLTRDELKPFIGEAAQELRLIDPFIDSALMLTRGGIDSAGVVEQSSTTLASKINQIAQEESIRLGPRYRNEIGANQNVRAYLYLNAVQVHLTPDGASVDRLRCATLTGKQVTVRARLFVLCCHGIENARLLLTSNDVMAQGIGNGSDHVGRYFMDHNWIAASKFIPSDAFPGIYNHDFGVAHSISNDLGFADRTVRDHRLLPYACRFGPVYAEPKTAAAYDRVRRDFMKPGNVSFLRDVATVAADFAVIPDFMAARRKIYFAKPLYYELEYHVAQAPNPGSRIVVSDRRDALGNLIADLDWRLSEADYRSWRVGQELLGAELAALGWGRMMPEEITPDLVRSRVAGVHHNIGTTRMSAMPSGGVVDSDCRVHGISNLYIGGSSVFPTAGGGSPTMMIIAMALRMSEHLKLQLDSGPRIAGTPS